MPPRKQLREASAYAPGPAHASSSIGPPTYMVGSVHNALILLNAIRDQGSLRLKDAAAEIHSAESTAHRLLSTLAYHNFVVRDERRRYLPGPALGLSPTRSAGARQLRDRCYPAMVDLGLATGEMITLVVRSGLRIRIIATVESTMRLRVGSRQGHVPPAAGTGGGRALLAELTDDEVRGLYAAAADDDKLSAAELGELLEALTAARRSGFGMQQDVLERGATSIGKVLRNARGQALGALVVALPTLRLRESLDAGLQACLGSTVQLLEPAIADLDVLPVNGTGAVGDPHPAAPFPGDPKSSG